MVYGAHESHEDLLGFQHNWTSYFFGPEIVSVVYFPLEGLSRLPQDPHVASSSLAQDLASVQDRHGAEEGGGGGFNEGLDLLASGGVGALFLPFMSSLKLWPDFGAISFGSLSEESST